ncbi:hypothetical protein Bca101_096897 [Brassica carinata]
MRSNFKRLFGEKDEIVFLQGIIDYNGKNPLEDRRSLYNSMKGSLSFDVTLRQSKENLQTMIKKYTTTKMTG